jgi:hypothetical protein
MTTPSAIVSMQFFNCEAVSSSETSQNSDTHTTDFFNSNKVNVGQATTDENNGAYTTTYRDATGKTIGRSEGTLNGDLITTKYFINEKLVGASKTYWSEDEHVTNYFDLNHNLISRSHTTKNEENSETTYNIPITKETERPSRYAPTPASFSISPLLEEARAKEERNNSQFSSSSPTMHRAQPDNPQNEPSIKRRRGCAIL